MPAFPIKPYPPPQVSWSVKDGDSISYGVEFGVLRGSARSILIAERVALNFLQRMSGIATSTNQMVRSVGGGGALGVARAGGGEGRQGPGGGGVAKARGVGSVAWARGGRGSQGQGCLQGRTREPDHSPRTGA